MAKHEVLNTFLKRRPDMHRGGLTEVLDLVDAQLQPSESVGDYEAQFIPAATGWDHDNKTLKLFFMSEPSAEKMTALERFGLELYECAKCFTEVWIVSADGLGETKCWDICDELAWTIPVNTGSVKINQLSSLQSEDR
jgi:hypothetical protein